MGIVLDSSVIIAGERRGHSVREILTQVQAAQGNTEIGVSVVTIAELEHGAYRAKTQGQQQQRLEFVERLEAMLKEPSAAALSPRSRGARVPFQTAR